MLCKNSAEAPSVTLCSFNIDKAILARVAYVQVGVEPAANSATHKSQQEIRILAAAEGRTCARANGLIEAQWNLPVRTADKIGVCRGRAEDVNPCEFAVRLPPSVSADPPSFILGAEGQDSIFFVLTKPRVYIVQGVGKVPTVIVREGQKLSAALRYPKIPRSRDTRGAAKMLQLYKGLSFANLLGHLRDPFSQ